jgi:hypothetical protein
MASWLSLNSRILDPFTVVDCAREGVVTRIRGSSIFSIMKKLAGSKRSEVGQTGPDHLSNLSGVIDRNSHNQRRRIQAGFDDC